MLSFVEILMRTTPSPQDILAVLKETPIIHTVLIFHITVVAHIIATTVKIPLDINLRLAIMGSRSNLLSRKPADTARRVDPTSSHTDPSNIPGIDRRLDTSNNYSRNLAGAVGEEGMQALLRAKTHNHYTTWVPLV